MTNNPLQKYFRKPSIYIKLPTGGKFNPEISTSQLDEIGVLPMTAIDEITLKYFCSGLFVIYFAS